MASSTGVRTVFRELRCSLNQPKIKDLKITQYILNQYRKHQITEKQHCKAAQEMNHLVDTYATYLSSQRKWQEVHTEYHAKGERTVSETARLVGFKLPHDPK